MIKKGVITSLLIFTAFILNGQSSIKTTEYTHWQVDNHGYIYLQSDHTIIKKDKTGKTIASWNTSKNNAISSFDATNTLRILVFYLDSYQFSLLDKNLIDVSSNIDLTSSTLNDIKAMCLSAKGDLWALDRQTNTIYSLQNNLNINYSFSIRLYCNADEVVKMTEYDQQLWLLQTDGSWIVLDSFGQLIKRHIFAGIEKAQISRNAIHFISNDQLIEYNLQLLSPDTIGTIKEPTKGCYIYNSNLYLFKDQSIEILPKP
ncbi:MAG: hypothetical protein PHU27_02085 [Salinivirgaceae bacterium]|nr:hypothetical protein [Salinivirgaceae bacterium]MDD4746199.1 hypothetical protein [Salinivirgaceae bacterium]MDY0281811.1 hypothetical protein [Salinivirgaceae bacterium]